MAIEASELPPLGTQVRVFTRYRYDWMNHGGPRVGTMAQSDRIDAPDTFRLFPANTCHGESVISLDKVEKIEIVGAEGAGGASDATAEVKVHEVLGSKGDVYKVTVQGGKVSCDCPAGKHGRRCRHVDQVT